MCTRRSSAACLLVLCVLAALVPSGAHAMSLPPLRDPQVTISGGGLQAFFSSRDQSIDVHTDQAEIQSWRAPRCPSSSFMLQLELGAASAGVSIGLYDATDVAPALFEVFPPHAEAGWFAVALFRDGPTRVVIHLFDEMATYHGVTEHLGGNRDAFGFYQSGPGGDFFTEDSRNPPGAPKFLSFMATAYLWGNWWIAAEDAALGAGADNDFDDLILFVEGFQCPDAVQRATWGAVKARFR